MGATVFVLRPEPGLSATLARGRKRGLAMEAMFLRSLREALRNDARI